MSDDDTTTAAKAEETFTRAQVRAMIAAEVRKVSERYADYDDLKAKAAEADKSKSALERIEAKFDQSEKRAAAAEAANLRREVADELGLTVKQAGRLKGSTREELLADGREYMEDNGIKPKSTTGGRQGGDGDDPDDDRGSQGKQDDDADRQPRRPRQRPTETLRSGAPATQGKPEETDPLKLVENVRRF